jgi:hypothetical protein
LKNATPALVQENLGPAGVFLLEQTGQFMTDKNETNDNFYQVTDPDAREWTMRPVPMHFYVMFGQLPGALSDRAMLALKQKDNDAFEKEIADNLTQKEIFDNLMFVREAVKYACVKPKITLTPQTPDEISPFDISPAAFDFLSRLAMGKGGGGGGKAAGLDSFRGQSRPTSGNRSNGKKLRKAAK